MQQSNTFVDCRWEKYLFKIQDDGIGFNTEEVKHRGGLINMQQRAEEINAHLIISSVVNESTLIELKLKV